jgi:hypothetical protein
VIGLKDICALLAAGSMGAGSVVAVQKATSHKASANVEKPTVSHTRKAQPVRKAYKLPSPGPAILDCPTPVIGSPWGIEHQPTGLTPPMSDALLPLLPPAIEQPGGGGIVLLPPSYSPAVPEPGAWAMMIAGFGLIGCSMRRRRVA